MIEAEHDVVIIGTGIAGAILAKELGKRKWKVLLLEAGDPIPNGREALVERFFLDPIKLPESPYEENKYAPRATVRDLITGDWRDAGHTYLDQSDSRIAFASTYGAARGARCGTGWEPVSACSPKISLSSRNTAMESIGL